MEPERLVELEVKRDERHTHLAGTLSLRHNIGDHRRKINRSFDIHRPDEYYPSARRRHLFRRIGKN